MQGPLLTLPLALASLLISNNIFAHIYTRFTATQETMLGVFKVEGRISGVPKVGMGVGTPHFSKEMVLEIRTEM